MEDLVGKSDRLIQKTKESMNSFDLLWKTITSEVVDFKIWDNFYNDAKETAARVAEILPEAFDGVDLSGLQSALNELENIVKGFFGDVDLTSVEGLQAILQTVIDTVTSFQNTANGVIGAWRPFFAFVSQLIDGYNNLDAATKESIGTLLGVAQQVVIVTGAVAGISAIMPGAVSAFKNLGAVLGPVGAVLGAGAAGWKAGEKLREWFPIVDEAAQGFFEVADSLLNFSGTQTETGETADFAASRLMAEAEAMQAVRKKAKETEEDLTSLDDAVSDFFSEVDGYEPKIGLSTADFLKEVDTLVEYYEDFSGKIEKPSEISATVDYTSVEKARGYIEDILPDGTRQITWIGEADKESIKKTKEEIEAEVPAEKLIKIQTDLQIAKLKEDSAVIQKAMEWKAKLDIAEAEANAEILKAQFASIDNTIQSTGDVIASVFGALNGLGGSVTDIQKKWLITEQLEKENALRQAAFELQKETSRIQNEYLKAKTERFKSGKGLFDVTIDGINLEADLRSMTNTILKYIQMTADQEGLESLI
jgi:hypothetical protein